MILVTTLKLMAVILQTVAHQVVDYEMAAMDVPIVAHKWWQLIPVIMTVEVGVGSLCRRRVFKTRTRK